MKARWWTALGAVCEAFFLSALAGSCYNRAAEAWFGSYAGQEQFRKMVDH